MQIRRLTPPLFSVFLFSIANGIIGLLLVIRLSNAGANVYEIGGLTSAYFAGLAIGSFRLGGIIARVGHIRAFSGFSAGLIIIFIFHSFYYQAWLWIGLRFLSGFLIGGLLLVIESWLIASSKDRERGRLLAVYMLLFYFGYAIGQIIIQYVDTKWDHLFSFSALIAALSIIPLCIARVQQPQIEEPEILSWSKLFSMTRVGLLGALTSGLLVSCVYGLLPVFYIKQPSVNAGDVGMFMAITIVGGVIMQYPIGKLSDIMNRPLLIFLLCLLIMGLSLSLMMVSSKLGTGILSFFFGGIVFTMYPLSISHACDRLSEEFALAGAQSLLLIDSIGATIGPPIASAFIRYGEASSLFMYYIVIVLPLMLLIAYYHFIYGKRRSPEEPYVYMPSGTTPIMAEIDPRIESDNN